MIGHDRRKVRRAVSSGGRFISSILEGGRQCFGSEHPAQRVHSYAVGMINYEWPERSMIATSDGQDRIQAQHARSGTVPELSKKRSSSRQRDDPSGQVDRSNLMIRRIIYVSRSLIRAEPREIDDIVQSSIRWNTTVEVTGMLWADGASFAQVVEGSPDKVALTMDRILADPRHTDIDVVLDREFLSRQFGNWSMRAAGDDDPSAQGNAFIIGLALRERTPASQRLYDIVLASS